MIISPNYAKRLIREKRATQTGATFSAGQWWRIVNRHDLQRVDHYPLGDDYPTTDSTTPSPVTHTLKG